jgi:hypothetical protein
MNCSLSQRVPLILVSSIVEVQIRLVSYTDSNRVGDGDDQKSTSGYVFLL